MKPKNHEPFRYEGLGNGGQLDWPSSYNKNINLKWNVKSLQWYSEWNVYRLLINQKKKKTISVVWFDWIQNPLDMRVYA